MTLPQPYNLTLALNNASSVVALSQSVNTNLMFGWYGFFVLLGIFCVTMMISYAVTNSMNKAFMAACWILFLSSIPFRIMGLITDLMMFGFLGLAAFSVALIKRE